MAKTENVVEELEIATLEELGLNDADRKAEASEEAKRIASLGPREAIPAGSTSFEVGDADLKELQAQFKRGGIEQGPDWQRVICMRMGRPGKETAKLFGWGAYGLDHLSFTPFAHSPKLHPLLVKCVTRQREHRRYGYAWNDYWIEPPVHMIKSLATGEKLLGKDGKPLRGDCKDNTFFLDKISGRRVKTCVYADCPHHPLPNGIWHSIHQAQRFVSLLKSEAVIRAYVRDFDPREDVAMFASLVIAQRQKAVMDAAGVGQNAATNMVF